jgi:hypothetical protein
MLRGRPRISIEAAIAGYVESWQSMDQSQQEAWSRDEGTERMVELQKLQGAAGPMLPPRTYVVLIDEETQLKYGKAAEQTGLPIAELIAGGAGMQWGSNNNTGTELDPETCFGLFNRPRKCASKRGRRPSNECDHPLILRNRRWRLSRCS